MSEFSMQDMPPSDDEGEVGGEEMSPETPAEEA